MTNKDIIQNMIRISIMHRRMMELALDRTGVYQGQHRILMQISENKYDSQKEIAIAMKVSTATMAIALKKLEKNGYIKKTMDDSDNRLNRIEITEKGQKVVRESKEIFDKLDQGTLDGFSEEEKEIFYNMLGRIEENISKTEKVYKKM